jgi:hypothetical protein
LLRLRAGPSAAGSGDRTEPLSRSGASCSAASPTPSSPSRHTTSNYLCPLLHAARGTCLAPCR